jgi:hypothetical protein
MLSLNVSGAIGMRRATDLEAKLGTLHADAARTDASRAACHRGPRVRPPAHEPRDGRAHRSMAGVHTLGGAKTHIGSCDGWQVVGEPRRHRLLLLQRRAQDSHRLPLSDAFGDRE